MGSLQKFSCKNKRGYNYTKRVSKEASPKKGKLLVKLQRTAYYYEADANQALQEYTTKLECTTTKQKQLIIKPKYKTKGRPKPNTTPEYYEYYWELETTPNEAYLKHQQDQKSGLFILATSNLYRFS